MRHPFASKGEALVDTAAMPDEFERDSAVFSLFMTGRPEIRTGHLINCAMRFLFAGVS